MPKRWVGGSEVLSEVQQRAPGVPGWRGRWAVGVRV